MQLRLGLDVGSTTAKVVVLDLISKKVLFTRYRRHNAEQMKTVLQLLMEVNSEFPDCTCRAAICGSGGKPIAEALGIYYIQEVVANASAIRALYPQARTAIELGGQDAKILFFYYDEGADRLVSSDMRMNGSCAGGTGAFIDEIASLLRVPVEEYESLATKGTSVYDISGRCGVFAKTDIQSLLNQGGRREDMALSAFHAIAKQTIGGLAQGLELTPPIVFEGGPLTFNPTLIRVFAERLDLKPTDIIQPEHPETIVAMGVALAVDELFVADSGGDCFVVTKAIESMIKALSHGGVSKDKKMVKPYFDSPQECSQWRKRRALPSIDQPPLNLGKTFRVYLGIDAGSTTSKFVLLDEEENVVDRFYSSNCGDPLRIIKKALVDLNNKYTEAGVKLEILGVGTTGYGEMLFSRAFGADYHTVETVAHGAAAQKYVPGVSFILDIGGQDMKALWLTDDIVTNITLNEACSSGCGSFLENFATSLGIPIERIAETAFDSMNPAELGSRCTVFMNSTIITEQKNGKQPEDIMAGICRSIIENVFTKVVRISNVSSLGKKIVVQGGTFKNDAVLRALEQYLGQEVTRAPYPGEMGCVGVALLTKRHIGEHGYGTEGKTQFIGFDEMEIFDYTQRDNVRCELCANQCSRMLTTFSNGQNWIMGNRCERGDTVGGIDSIGSDWSKKPLPDPRKKSVPDMLVKREKWLFEKYEYTRVSSEKDMTIGLPRTLEFWDSMPFWTTFFHALGFKTKFSRRSSKKMYEKGIQFVTSDTVCFPAKLVHGHIDDLIQQDVDRIFMPMIMQMPSEGTSSDSNYVCAVVKGYPLIIRNSDNPEKRWGTPFDSPMFHWYKEEDRKQQICDYMHNTFDLSNKEISAAYAQGVRSLMFFRSQLVKEGKK